MKHRVVCLAVFISLTLALCLFSTRAGAQNPGSEALAELRSQNANEGISAQRKPGDQTKTTVRHKKHRRHAKKS